MKVGIDAQPLGSRRGGDETYIRNVVRALASVDPDGDYTLYLDHHMPDLHIPGVEHMKRVVVPHGKIKRRFSVGLPLALVRDDIDVVHLQYMMPPICPARTVVSVHDIAFERYPQFFSPGDVAYLRRLVRLTVHRVALVLTLSEFSKQDIVRRYCVPAEKVVVAPCAADPMFRPIHDLERLAAVRARYDTGKHYILCVGNLQPRKNLRTLIAAYIRLRQADATRHRLVIVGRRAWLYDDIFTAARASGYVDDFVFTDYVPDDDLVTLYSAADLFVYPSFFEGFGLPPLEAMACGTPVITSNTSALPETVGDAALTVCPSDVETLAGTIAAVLRDAALHADLSQRGLERAATFSWEATARTLLTVYKHVLHSNATKR